MVQIPAVKTLSSGGVLGLMEAGLTQKIEGTATEEHTIAIRGRVMSISRRPLKTMKGEDELAFEGVPLLS